MVNWKRYLIAALQRFGVEMAKIDAPIGSRFGKLILLAECESTTKPNGQKLRLVQAICDCGNKKVFNLFNVLYGKSNSCGCNRTGNPTHGMSCSPTWISWAAMIQRCNDAKCVNFVRYGAIGISVCDRWSDFSAFLADMGERPDGTSIDRFPNASGNYEPGNCRWATLKQQARNTRTNRLLTFQGQTLSLSEWAEIQKINSSTLFTRLSNGWTVQRALTTPTKQCAAALNN